ncbi:MAG: hypothetical protein ABGX16_20070 [Pirellulales bacterium]
MNQYLDFQSKSKAPSLVEDLATQQEESNQQVASNSGESVASPEED